jgi:predicted phosphodiesterase
MIKTQKIELKTDEQIAICGGPYSNFSSLEAFIKETQIYQHRYCLGDIGGFGPLPDRSISLLQKNNIVSLQGNYDQTVGDGEVDCGCGKFAQISFDYTFKNTSDINRAWLRSLPQHILLKWGDEKILLCHGSPDEINEFVFESEVTDEKIDLWLLKFGVDAICVTHSGIPWIRNTTKGSWVNVGVLGRPAHEGLRRVFYATAKMTNQKLDFEIRALDYNPDEVIEVMRKEGLPEEFCQSLLIGEWTTCAAILPSTERKLRKRFFS